MAEAQHSSLSRPSPGPQRALDDLRPALLDQLAYLIDEVEALKAVVQHVPEPVQEARPPGEVLSIKETYHVLARLDETVYLPRARQMATGTEPHFDAVKDHYASFEVEPGERLEHVERVGLQINPAVRDNERHYAACRDDGLLIVVAPQTAQLPPETLVPLLCHEFGHAADFLYPARWAGRRGDSAVWVPNGTRKMAQLRRAWSERSIDQVEWDADSIALAVTGRQIQYCGPCLIQCFSGGQPRPKGLR